MSPTPQTPPTDRPLTAGDNEGWIPNPGFNPVGEAKVDTKHANGAINLGWTAAQWSVFWGIDRQQDPQDITHYRLARPATSAASEAEGVEPWEPAAEAMCAEVIKRAEVTCRKATDELYEGLLYSVQDYLRENVTLNLSGELERAHGYERDARAALVEIAKAAGVAFVDSRDGVERQKERILAALASPPVSERERELEGALRMAANRMDRLAFEVQFDTRLRAEAADWVAEARALTAQPAGEGK